MKTCSVRRELSIAHAGSATGCRLHVSHQSMATVPRRAVATSRSRVRIALFECNSQGISQSPVILEDRSAGRRGAAGVRVGLVRDPPASVDPSHGEEVDEVAAEVVGLDEHRHARVADEIDAPNVGAVIRAG